MLLNGLEQPETHAVVRAWPVCSDSSPVRSRRIPCVLFPMVFRKLTCQPLHMLVAKGFSQNRSGCNVPVEAVATNNAGMFEAGKWAESVAINQ